MPLHKSSGIVSFLMSHVGSIYPGIQIIRAAEDRYTTFHIYTILPSDRRMSGARAIVLLQFRHVARPRV